MYTTASWVDYALLDAAGGERLERWGDKILVRPDPQIIWNTQKKLPQWNNFDARYIRARDGGGYWEKKQLPDSWEIAYGAMRFTVRPTNFKHTGLFPEQAANWDYTAHKIAAAGRRIKVLNLFAYTGAATVAAAKAGAEVCHVDAAKGMVQWARGNAKSSGVENAPVRWIVDDCVKFLEREIRRGNKYDAVMMDPPSYGRGPGGETWKLEEGLFRLVTLTRDVLSDEPLFILLNSYTTGLSPATLKYVTDSLLVKKFGGTSEAEELGLKVEASGLYLPCGAAVRWEPRWQ